MPARQRNASFGVHSFFHGMMCACTLFGRCCSKRKAVFDPLAVVLKTRSGLILRQSSSCVSQRIFHLCTRLHKHAHVSMLLRLREHDQSHTRTQHAYIQPVYIKKERRYMGIFVKFSAEIEYFVANCSILTENWSTMHI